MLLDAMTRKPKWCGAPHFSQASQSSGRRGERQKLKGRRAERMKTSGAQRWRATENRFVTTTGIQSHKPAPSAAATRRYLTERREETEQWRAIAAAELVSAGVTRTHQGRRRKGGRGGGSRPVRRAGFVVLCHSGKRG